MKGGRTIFMAERVLTVSILDEYWSEISGKLIIDIYSYQIRR